GDGIPVILLRYRVALVLSILTLAGMIVLMLPFVPAEWQIPYNVLTYGDRLYRSLPAPAGVAKGQTSPMVLSETSGGGTPPTHTG
ncbi:937_t:CDS:2, partial [Acaulospora colombiana]